MTLKKLCFVSLGCDKNLVDSEKMLAILEARGFTPVSGMEEADLIVINSCCFILDAKEQSLDALLEAVRIKTEVKPQLKIILAGCMAQHYREDVLESLPQVDAIVGTNSWHEIGRTAQRVMEEGWKGKCLIPLNEPCCPSYSETGRMLTGSGSYAYLKIAEGCDKRCTYCIIPFFRGPYRSVPMEELVKESRDLAGRGVRELLLVAQETTLYGKDLYGKKMLPQLLKELSAIDGIEWIRILYCYPEEIEDELIEAIRSLPKVCHYLDIPIQHASDHILRRMGRRTNGAEIRERLKALRNAIPDIRIRTTLITGFPGETEKDHRILCDFVKEMQFDRLGCFRYSREAGSRAAEFSHQISKREKDRRYDEIMRLQQQVVLEKARSYIGCSLDVFLDDELTEGAPESQGTGYLYIGRSYMDLPEVDGHVVIHTNHKRKIGSMEKVRITSFSGYDLIGAFEDENESSQ